MASPNLGFGLLRRRQGMRETRAGAYHRLTEGGAAARETNHCGQRIKSPLQLETRLATDNKTNKTLRRSRHRNAERRRRRGDRRLEDRRRGEGTRRWMLTCCGGGAGWSGGSESDEIRWRRRGGWSGMGW